LPNVEIASHGRHLCGFFSILIEESEKSTVVSLKPTATCQNPDEAAGQFCNEVLDQELREEIAAETRGVRDLLLAHAFSKTSLIVPVR